MPVIPIPDKVIALLVTVFASGAALYKIIDGLKNILPWIKDQPTLLKILNFVGNFLIVGGACFVVGQVHDLFDLLKCITAAVMASLVSAGLYEAKKASDLARAGGAAALMNVKAVAEVESNVVAPRDIEIVPPKKGR